MEREGDRRPEGEDSGVATLIPPNPTHPMNKKLPSLCWGDGGIPIPIPSPFGCKKSSGEG